ncbi:MAG: DNA topoisomerase III, partial [Planctomycetes bacterium]|nr:DNA topoisomerase III [Planctomycetota bacterium]
MKVLVAEKPSVARELAAYLGARRRRDGYFEGDDCRVTWAIGHLVGLKEPQDYDPVWQRWSLQSLPILPRRFELKALDDPRSRAQLDIVLGLIRAADELICATDAGREGELIFRYILELGGCTDKPVQRLWLSALTESAIAAAFADLRPASEFDRLYAAARSRSQADWLVGINGTRAYTVRFGRGVLWSLGRVQTPVLALIAARDDEIHQFVAEPWHELRTRYRKVWFKHAAERFRDPQAANALLERVRAAPLTIQGLETKEERLPPPPLYDLTSLQRDLNTAHGLSAADTLQYAQELYERKAITYPRTDARHLPDSMHAELVATLRRLGRIERFAPWIARLDLDALPRSPRVFDDTKVSDHHAIVPTGNAPNGGHALVYEAIVRRTVAAFYPVCRREVTTVAALVEDVPFKARGTRVVDPGHTVLEEAPARAGTAPRGRRRGAARDGEDAEGDSDQELPELRVGESGPHQPEVRSGETRPPRPFTESTLLGAMETAGKLV